MFVLWMPHQEFGDENKELLFGVKFDFASDGQAADGIKNALRSFLHDTVGDGAANNLDGFSFAQTAQGKQQCHCGCIHMLLRGIYQTRVHDLPVWLWEPPVHRCVIFFLTCQLSFRTLSTP